MAKFKILIVDDAPFIRELLIGFFEKSENHEFEVFEAENGQKGFESFIENKPQLIIMDIVMPVLSGIEATKKIRAIDASVPIIGLSTLEEGDIIERLKGAGANKFIQKPFQISDLKTAFEEFLK